MAEHAEPPKRATLTEYLPVMLCGLTIPVSIIMWLGNVAFTNITNHNGADEDRTTIPPLRWLFSVLVPVLLMIYGLRRKGVNGSGAICGLLFAIILSIASHSFLACLFTFFMSSSKATKFRAAQKAKIEEDHKAGEGQRNWVQVLCNAGMATQLALLYLLDCGSGERPIDFGHQYRASWLAVGIMSSFACCNGDTWASELGTVLGSGDPFLITTRKRVPRGTNGGVTFIGLLVSFLGGLLIGVSYFLVIKYTLPSDVYAISPPQWPIIVFGGVAGLLGSVIDSILGATLQFSGQTKKEKIVEHPGPGVKHISGNRILDNHSVNLISTILTGIVMPFIAFKCWP